MNYKARVKISILKYRNGGPNPEQGRAIPIPIILLSLFPGPFWVRNRIRSGMDGRRTWTLSGRRLDPKDISHESTHRLFGSPPPSRARMVIYAPSFGQVQPPTRLRRVVRVSMGPTIQYSCELSNYLTIFDISQRARVRAVQSLRC